VPARLEFAAVKAGPESTIRIALTFGRRREHVGVLAIDFGERVARRELETVGGDERTAD